MKWPGIAMLLMVVATISVHMGLPQAIAEVVTKVSKCHKCLSFWLTLLGLLVIGCPPLYAVLLSPFTAYLSNWFGLLLIMLNEIYEKLWGKTKR